MTTKPRLAAALQDWSALRILLLEDDRSIRETTSLVQECWVPRHRSRRRARRARSLRHETFDLVVLDLMLPGLDGYEVCREIRKSSAVPIAILSARSDTVDVAVGLELGADDYVTKPFELPELVATRSCRACRCSHDRSGAASCRRPRGRSRGLPSPEGRSGARPDGHRVPDSCSS